MGDSRIGVTDMGGTSQVQPPKNWLEQADAAPNNAVRARSRGGEGVGGALKTAAGNGQGLATESRQMAQAVQTGASGQAQPRVGGTKSDANKPATTANKADAADTKAANNKAFNPGKLLGDLTSIGLPDSIVVTSDKMRSRSNSKNFALLNPVTLKGTHFINHPQSGKVIGGLRFTHVEAAQYTLDGKGTRREDGVGYVQSYGNVKNPSTFFINPEGETPISTTRPTA
jgi:hypothetical protein